MNTGETDRRPEDAHFDTLNGRGALEDRSPHAAQPHVPLSQVTSPGQRATYRRECALEVEQAELILSERPWLIVGAFVADQWLEATEQSFPA